MLDAGRTVEAVWRMESARLIGALTRLVRDVGLAEQLAQDAFVLALEQWPEQGVPDNPGAWLMATARHKAVDLIRRERSLDEKYGRIAATSGAEVAPAPDAAVEDPVGDARGQARQLGQDKVGTVSRGARHYA